MVNMGTIMMISNLMNSSNAIQYEYDAHRFEQKVIHTWLEDQFICWISIHHMRPGVVYVQRTSTYHNIPNILCVFYDVNIA